MTNDEAFIAWVTWATQEGIVRLEDKQDTAQLRAAFEAGHNWYSCEINRHKWADETWRQKHALRH